MSKYGATKMLIDDHNKAFILSINFACARGVITIITECLVELEKFVHIFLVIFINGTDMRAVQFVQVVNFFLSQKFLFFKDKVFVCMNFGNFQELKKILIALKSNHACILFKNITAMNNMQQLFLQTFRTCTNIQPFMLKNHSVLDAVPLHSFAVLLLSE